VTIGIPFLNARPTLPDAVRSVLAQTFADWELLLVDDGSSDGSLDWARTIRDERITVVSDGVNRGLVARLNLIAGLARGKYLARMDADDLMHPRRLEEQVRFLEANPRVEVIDTAACTIDEHNAPIGIRGDGPLDCDVRAVLRSGLLIHPAVMGRTSWFRGNPYHARFVWAEDHELWVRTCRRSAFDRLQEPLLFYRESLAGNLGNYLRGARTVRAILRLYGPGTIGYGPTAGLIACSCLKSLTYWTLTKLGRQGRLIRARTRPLSAAESTAAGEALRVILQTRMPTSDRVDHEPTHAGPAGHPPYARLHGAADVELPRSPGGVRAGPGV
jgi:glycosyltransferase involved in cell wall biosynthesis